MRLQSSGGVVRARLEPATPRDRVGRVVWALSLLGIGAILASLPGRDVRGLVDAIHGAKFEGLWAVWLVLLSAAALALLGFFACAMWMLLRAVWGVDEIEVDEAALRVAWRVGPFARRRRFGRRELVLVELSPDEGTLVAQDGQGYTRLTTLGTRDERGELCRALRAALGIGPSSEVGEGAERVDPLRDDAPPLPPGWRATPTGSVVLLQGDSSKEPVRVIVVVPFAVAVFGVWSLAGRPWAVSHMRETIAIAVGAFAAAIAFAASGRVDWLVSPGGLERRARLLGLVSWSRTLKAEFLEVVRVDPPFWSESQTVSFRLRVRTSGGKVGVYEGGDAQEVVQLARWMASAAAVPLRVAPGIGRACA